MFQEFLEKHNVLEKKIAVGVSGGSDSLGLLLMMSAELKPLGYQIVALTVDHKLRPSSSDEALYVAQIAQKFKIEHHTLVWEGTKPLAGIEEAARIARYKLIEDWCKRNNIRYLVTAHHLYDQAETFLMHLARGSALDGLCGMKEVTKLGQLIILRPALKTSPLAFKEYLKKQNIQWIEDETNNDEKLLRVKMRHFLPVMEEKIGISPEKIVETMFRLQNTQQYVEGRIQKLLKNNFFKLSEKIYHCPYNFFILQEAEIAYRLIKTLIKNITNDTYPPRSEKVLNLITKIKNEKFCTATLGHCLIVKKNDFLWFLPEIKDLSVYNKEKWKNFLEQHPVFKRQKLPLAAKKALLRFKLQ